MNVPGEKKSTIGPVTSLSLVEVILLLSRFYATTATDGKAEGSSQYLHSDQNSMNTVLRALLIIGCGTAHQDLLVHIDRCFFVVPKI